MLFPYKTESKEFGQCLFELAAKAQKESISNYLSKDNIYSFKHGRGWLTVREDETEESSFNKIGIELVVRHEDLLKNDITQLFQFLNTFIDGFTSQTIKGVYQKISETCDKVGNVVNQNEFSSQAEAFLESLKKVEFSVNEDGTVVLPQIHLGQEAHKALIQSIKAQGEVYQAEIERIIQEKSEEALKKEKIRLSKYKGNNI